MQEKVGATLRYEASIGVCVLNWNAGDKLRQCIESIRVAVQDHPHSIVVVDNNSTDGSVETLLRGGITVLRNRTNVGYARGNNIGAKHLLDDGCSYLMFVNPDATITTGTVANLLAGLNSDSTIGCCGGLALTAGQVSPMAARTKPTLFEKLVLYGPLGRWPGWLRRRHFLNVRGFSGPTKVYAVSGACLMFKSEAFRAIDGFDEKTFLYEEEFIVSERLTKRGWSTAISPTAFFSHSEGHSTKRIPNLRRLHFIRSEQHLLGNYYHWSKGLQACFLMIRVVELPTFFLRNLFPRARDARESPDRSLRAAAGKNQGF